MAHVKKRVRIIGLHFGRGGRSHLSEFFGDRWAFPLWRFERQLRRSVSPYLSWLQHHVIVHDHQV